jgi:predicted metal-dependent phosphoesterase TrpH
MLDPKSILKLALKRGLSVIAVTDHNTIQGGIIAKKIVKDLSIKNLIVIPGVEIKTNFGDLIGLFIENEILTKDFYDAINSIKAQDGLIILPHPFKSHKNAEQLIAAADVVEALNGRTSAFKNDQALHFSKVAHKPVVASSDAHFGFELGHVRMRFYGQFSDLEDLKQLIIKNDRSFIGKEFPPVFVHYFSFGLELLKRTLGANFASS